MRGSTELVNGISKCSSDVAPLVGWLAAVDKTLDGVLLDEEPPLNDGTDEIEAVEDSC